MYHLAWFILTKVVVPSSGSRGGARGTRAPLILSQKKNKTKKLWKNAEGRKACRASDIGKSILLQHLKKRAPPSSLLSSRYGSATDIATSRLDSSVPLTHHDPKYLGLMSLVKKRKIHFWILSGFRIQSWIFLTKRTLRNERLRMTNNYFISKRMRSS